MILLSTRVGKSNEYLYWLSSKKLLQFTAYQDTFCAAIQKNEWYVDDVENTFLSNDFVLTPINYLNVLKFV